MVLTAAQGSRRMEALAISITMRKPAYAAQPMISRAWSWQLPNVTHMQPAMALEAARPGRPWRPGRASASTVRTWPRNTRHDGPGREEENAVKTVGSAAMATVTGTHARAQHDR